MISSAAERPGSLSVPAARNAPRQIAARSPREPGGELVGQPAHRSAPLVEQAGLAGERLAALDHAHGVVAAGAGTRALHVHELGTHAVELHEVAGDAAGEDVGVEFRLDRDAIRDRVQAAREPQQRRELGHPRRRARVAHGDQLGLHVSGQRHGSPRGSGSERASSLLGGRPVVYSRPRSRCLTRTATPGTAASRSASSRAITTERCLPPVQPTATTEWRLFSRW